MKVTRYDAEADVLCINLKKPAVATGSELTDDDVIVRYDGDEVIGITILHASERLVTAPTVRAPQAGQE